MLRRSSKPQPWSPADEAASRQMFAKDRFKVQPAESIDTTALPFRKIHPDRNDGYKRWLKFQPCSIEGSTDKETDQVHVCWSPEEIGLRRFASDPAHAGKSYSGKLKRNDSGCMSLCRHAHNSQEDNHDRFDRRYGIDRFAIAEGQFAEYVADCEKRGVTP
jgi:hypothetical protein